jgi:exosortase F-associated protein
MQNKILKIVLLLILVSLLACVRGFENQLFYDPFLDYFKDNFESMPLPNFDGWQLFTGFFLRYLSNSVFSLSIIYVLFREIELVKFASVLYVVFFAILILAFFSLIYFYEKPNNLSLFYIRRFIIQPLFLLLFVPGFYYQKRMDKKKL